MGPGVRCSGSGSCRRPAARPDTVPGLAARSTCSDLGRLLTAIDLCLPRRSVILAPADKTCSTPSRSSFSSTGGSSKFSARASDSRISLTARSALRKSSAQSRSSPCLIDHSRCSSCWRSCCCCLSALAFQFYISLACQPASPPLAVLAGLEPSCAENGSTGTDGTNHGQKHRLCAEDGSQDRTHGSEADQDDNEPGELVHGCARAARGVDSKLIAIAFARNWDRSDEYTRHYLAAREPCGPWTWPASSLSARVSR